MVSSSPLGEKPFARKKLTLVALPTATRRHMRHQHTQTQCQQDAHSSVLRACARTTWWRRDQQIPLQLLGFEKNVGAERGIPVVSDNVDGSELFTM